MSDSVLIAINLFHASLYVYRWFVLFILKRYGNSKEGLPYFLLRCTATVCVTLLAAQSLLLLVKNPLQYYERFITDGNYFAIVVVLVSILALLAVVMVRTAYAVHYDYGNWRIYNQRLDDAGEAQVTFQELYDSIT